VKNESANAVGDKEGVWMAVINDSGDKDMADNNFEVAEDSLLFFEDNENVKDLATHLKKLLNITTPPYNNPHDIFDVEDSTDSSDNDDTSAAAMQVTSEFESDSEIEINPYWSKIKVNKLQGLGNLIVSLESDIDSMPDLEDVFDSDMSEDSVIFVITSPNSFFSTDSEKDSLENNHGSISGREMIDLVVDEGKEGLTGFYATMLVNMESSVQGIQTKLYNSGASQHMSFYREHFKNYVFIVPKLITTADKHCFQAIGKGDLRIKLPNGPATTTILLNDILHCLDMGLTLVSIGKIMATSYKVIFQGPTCKFFNS
jgi:hypothetical protein